jgi:hypothetical protein
MLYHLMDLLVMEDATFGFALKLVLQFSLGFNKTSI